MELNTFFKGLKVVEFASVLAGPAVGMFFAELGAEVVKVENATTEGDMTRRWKLPTEDPNSLISAYFCSINWGKRSLFLDLSTSDGQSTAQSLLRDADVVLSNFKPKAAHKFGISAELCRTLNPKIIFAQLDAYADPDDPRPAFDMVMQAETGFLYMCGESDRPPVKMPVALIDILAAHQLKEAILLALLKREKTGEGSTVRVSLQEAALASLANQATNWLMGNTIPQRIGSQHPNIAPYGDFFECEDGKQLVLAVGTERQWQQLCVVLENNSLAEEPKFRTNQQRLQHRKSLNEALQHLFLQKKRDEWLIRCAEENVPAAAIRPMDEVFAQPEAQAMILEETIDGALTKRVKTVAFSL